MRISDLSRIFRGQEPPGWRGADLLLGNFFAENYMNPKDLPLV